jgi:hypothetical protein
MVRRLFSTGNAAKRSCVLFDRTGDGFVIYELPFTARFNQPSLDQNLQMVRDCCRRDSLQRDDLATVHMLLARNRFEDHQAGLVGQSLGDFLNLRKVHHLEHTVGS